MQKDVDYVVEDGQVVIVDSFTGRLMKATAATVRGFTKRLKRRKGLRFKTKA